MFKPAKKKGWEKVQITKDITLMVGRVREKHQTILMFLSENHLADAADRSLQATLRLQEILDLFRREKLGKHGYDLRVLIDWIEEEDQAVWSAVMRSVRKHLS